MPVSPAASLDDGEDEDAGEDEGVDGEPELVHAASHATASPAITNPPLRPTFSITVATIPPFLLLPRAIPAPGDHENASRVYGRGEDVSPPQVRIRPGGSR